MPMLFLNSWRVSSHIVRYDTNPPAIQKQPSMGKIANLMYFSKLCIFASFLRTPSVSHRHFKWAGTIDILYTLDSASIIILQFKN